MGLSQTVAPDVYPITLEEAKAHLRVTASDEDDLIQSIIAAATARAETFTGRCFVTQQWRESRDHFPHCGQPLCLPNPPLQNVSAITYTDQNGDVQTWDSDLYIVDAMNLVGRVAPAYNETYPSTRCQPNAVLIDFACGYGLPESVPPQAKAAIKIDVGHLFLNREYAVTGMIITSVPMGWESLLNTLRVVTLP